MLTLDAQLNASQILQNWQGHKTAVPLFLQTRDITALARGMETHVTATIFSTVAAALANAGRLKEAVNVQKDVVAIFTARFGAEDERTKDAEGTLEQLMKLAVRKEKGENDRVLRLMRRMRTDEGRAREIIARSTAAAMSAELKGKTGRPGGTAMEIEAKEAMAPTPSFAHLDIDEIVAIIEGGPASAAAASKRRSLVA